MTRRVAYSIAVNYAVYVHLLRRLHVKDYNLHTILPAEFR